MDAQRIHNLTSYLQALHEQNRANADHTTLLLNCYTKLKDESKLNEFIKPDSGYRFDVETAIKVCRQAGYFGHALSLARTHNKHEWYLKILLGDTTDFPSALDYIATLDFHEAEKNMKLYGKAMMDKLPERTTEFLFQLCTFYVPTKSDFGIGTSSSSSPSFNIPYLLIFSFSSLLFQSFLLSLLPSLSYHQLRKKHDEEMKGSCLKMNGNICFY